MKTSSTFLKLVTVLASMVLFGATQSPQPADTNSTSPEEEVRRLSAEEVAAFLKNDPAAMARIWSDDLIVTNPLNRLVTKQQILDMVHSGFLVITSYQREIEYLHVYNENTVIVAGSETVVFGGKMPITGRKQQLRFTAVWMLQGGRWQEVARHANVIPSQE
jgi:uncharacterized protein (TIGR02246 family)